MIDPKAEIHPKARIGTDVTVGPWSYIGPDVEIGDGTIIGPHVVIRGPTTLGRHNKIYQYSSIGEECQDKKYKGEPTRLEVGDYNCIREYCTLHRGTVQDNSVTRIGNHNLFMVHVHIAHDCVVGDHTIFANNATLGGHVTVGDYAFLGGFAAIHQFCLVGAYSMCAGGAIVTKDVPAYVTVSGNPASSHGVNIELMRRQAFDKHTIETLKKAYKVIYRQKLTLKEALLELKNTQNINTQANEMDSVNKLALLIESLESSQRGIVR